MKYLREILLLTIAIAKKYETIQMQLRGPMHDARRGRTYMTKCMYFENRKTIEFLTRYLRFEISQLSNRNEPWDQLRLFQLIVM